MSETLFIKLMMMTTSSHDGEVLTAIRKANAILAGQNLNWEEFIIQMSSASAPQPTPTSNGHTEEWHDVGAKPKPKPKPAGPQNTYGGPGIDQIFDKLLSSVLPGDTFRSFVLDVQSYYHDKGYITQRQYDVLKRSYDKRKGR